MLEKLGEIYFIEELVSTRCNHIFVEKSDENKYQCVRCGTRAKKEPSREQILQVDNINYYNACKIYEKVIENTGRENNRDEIMLKMLDFFDEYRIHNKK